MKNLQVSCTSKKSYWTLILGLIAVALAVTVLSLCLGAVKVPVIDVLKALVGRGEGVNSSIILLSRLPRTVGCLVAGATLAVSGAVIQSVLGNPLASPGIIGVNAGAGLASVACFAILTPAVSLRVAPIASFFGAFVGVMLVLTIAKKAGAARITLVLAGIAIANIFNAAIDAVVTLCPNALIGYSDFRIGGLNGVSMSKILPAIWIALVCFVLLILMHNELDILQMGDETAQSLGLSAHKFRTILLTIAAALAGAAVSFTGLLSFVGLIAPNLVRQIAGSDSRILLPASAIGGAILVTFCDTLARVLFAPYELPVGIIMSLLGGPFFIWLLLRQRGGRTG